MPVRPEELEAHLATLRSRVRYPEAGIYGPGSLSWMVSRESAIILGGGCAALLQLAHPFVAYAIDQHSLTRSDPVERFRRTFAHVFDMVFGDLDHAVGAARAVYAVHQKIRGRIREGAGRFARGAAYRANDEEALYWVQATLTHTSLAVYELLIGPLMPFERERYYRESRAFSRLFGIPEALIPADLEAFEGYFQRTVASEEIVVTAPAKELASHILAPPSLAMRPLFRWLRLFTAGLMPPRLRAPFGLTYGPAEERLFRGSTRALRRALRLVPERLRWQPAYFEAQRRLRGEAGPDTFGRWLEGLVLSTLEGDRSR